MSYSHQREEGRDVSLNDHDDVYNAAVARPSVRPSRANGQRSHFPLHRLKTKYAAAARHGMAWQRYKGRYLALSREFGTYSVVRP